MRRGRDEWLGARRSEALRGPFVSDSRRRPANCPCSPGRGGSPVVLTGWNGAALFRLLLEGGVDSVFAGCGFRGGAARGNFGGKGGEGVLG